MAEDYYNSMKNNCTHFIINFNLELLTDDRHKSLGIEPAVSESDDGSFDRLGPGFKHRYCGRFILRVGA